MRGERNGFIFWTLVGPGDERNRGFGTESPSNQHKKYRDLSQGGEVKSSETE